MLASSLLLLLKRELLRSRRDTHTLRISCALALQGRGWGASMMRAGVSIPQSPALQAASSSYAARRDLSTTKRASLSLALPERVGVMGWGVEDSQLLYLSSAVGVYPARGPFSAPNEPCLPLREAGRARVDVSGEQSSPQQTLCLALAVSFEQLRRPLPRAPGRAELVSAPTLDRLRSRCRALANSLASSKQAPTARPSPPTLPSPPPPPY